MNSQVRSQQKDQHRLLARLIPVRTVGSMVAAYCLRAASLQNHTLWGWTQLIPCSYKNKCDEVESKWILGGR